MSVHVAHEDPHRIEDDPWREAGRTGVSKSVDPKFAGGKITADQLSHALDQALKTLTPVLTGPPDHFIGTDSKTYVAKDSVPIEQAMNNGANANVPAPVGQAANYGQVGHMYLPMPPHMVQAANQQLDAAAARMRRRRIVIGLVVGGLIVFGLSGLFGGLAAGGVFNAPPRPKAKDEDENLPDPLAPVDFGDLLGANQDSNAGDSVVLLDDNGAQTTGPLKHPEGTWTLANNNVTFTLTPAYSLPAPGGSFTASYTIITGQGGSPWGSGALRVHYAPTGAVIPPVTANDRVMTLTVPVLSATNNPGFVGTVQFLNAVKQTTTSVVDPNGAGTWNVDANNVVTFQPATPAVPNTVPSVTVPYVLVLDGLASKPQNLIINFPASPPPKPVANPITLAGTASPVNFDIPGKNGNFAGTASLWDGTGQQTSLKDAATGGAWTVDPLTRHILFTYSGAVAGATVTVKYVLVLNNAVSDPAQLEIDFPGATPQATPIQVPATLSPVDIDVPGKNGNSTAMVSLWDGTKQTSTVTDPSTGGVWTVDPQTGHITFAYTSPITGNVAVKTQYVLVLNGMVSPPAALEVDFPGGIPMPPAPAAITVPGVPSPVDIDVPGKNGSFAGTVSLWDGTKQIPTLNDPATGGVWAVDPQTRHVTFTFPAAITGTVTVKAQYVLVLNGFVSAPGALEIDFVPPPGKPGDLSLSNGSRTSFAIFDIPRNNPGLLQASDQIQLVSGTSRVSKLVTADGIWEVQSNNSVEFTPKVPCTPPSVSIACVVVRSVAESAPATLTLNFTLTPEAYPCYTTSMDRSAVMIADLLTSSVTPKGLASIELYADASTATSSTSLTTADGTWTVDLAHTAVNCQITNAAVDSMTIYYTVTDKAGIHSIRTSITATIVSPMAMHFLLAQDVDPKTSLAANVLADGISQFAKDPRSVVLLGLADVGRKQTARSAYLSEDQKTMQVAGEGNWLVDENGLIVFKADPNATDPPTPVSFQFSDVKGNKSTPAMVLIDPAVAGLTPFFNGLAAQSDVDFWKAYKRITIDDPPLPLDADEVLAIAQSYALAVRRLLPYETPSPVPDAEYAKAYKTWFKKGNGNDDLLAICLAEAEKATKTNRQPFVTRYWALNLMVRMLVDFLK